MYSDRPAKSRGVQPDALFGALDIIALVGRTDIADVDAVIDRIAEIPETISTDSKVAR
ncbi:hypothetical protein GF407_11345 [candidate division KSB1 bacterium]|nr:hypothetical protein [candidate division KSB1 bacterium]